jgi:2-oxoglutarate dehydrogenase E1 component
LKEQDRPLVALARIEQLYPFPEAAVAAEISRYPGLEEIVWLQEEPANMGAWAFLRPCLEALAAGHHSVRVISRPRRASPAEGSTTWHRRNQRTITEQAFDFDRGKDHE